MDDFLIFFFFTCRRPPSSPLLILRNKGNMHTTNTYSLTCVCTLVSCDAEVALCVMLSVCVEGGSKSSGIVTSESAVKKKTGDAHPSTTFTKPSSENRVKTKMIDSFNTVSTPHFSLCQHPGRDFELMPPKSPFCQR